MKIWWVIIGVGAVSLLLRASTLALWRGGSLPEPLRRALNLVPAAVLSALIVPDVVVREHRVELLSVRPVVAVVAGLVAWRTRNVFWTLVVGLGLLFAARALGWS